MQYELIIENGKVKSENGSFFLAAPFTIQSGSSTVTILFKAVNDHEVMYSVEQNGKSILKLEHPDYIPGVSPEILSKEIQIPGFPDSRLIFDAFSRLGVSKSKTYKTYFDDPTNVAFSYSVEQQPLFN